MNPPRRILLVIVIVLLAGGVYFIWSHPTVQNAQLSRASLTSLGQRVGADPGNWRAQYWYGKRLAEAGRFPEAEAALRFALGTQPDDLSAVTELGKVILAQNRVEEAFQFLSMAAGRDPKNVEARIGLGNLYRTQGAYQRAMDVLIEALKLEPKNGRALYELGAAQASVKQYSAAEATIRRALEQMPNDRLALVGLARVLRFQGKLDEAEVTARKAERLDPNDVEALVMLAQILARRQPLATNREEALRLLQRARELEPGRSDILSETARIEVARGRWREALTDLRTVIRLDPSRTQAYYLLSQAYRRLGQPAEARSAEAIFHAKDAYDREVEALRDQITADAESADLRFKLGEVHASGGHLDRAISSYRSGLERAPQNERARKRLAELMRQVATQ